MKYRVIVPPPKAKRMVGNGKLVITLHHGWEGQTIKEVPAEAGTKEFEIPNDYEWIYKSSCNDGYSFTVEAKYENKDGTRQEIIRLVPEKI